MASIFKRKRSKFWYVKYYVNGRQVYRSLETTSERVALKLKAQIEADETRGGLVAPSRTPLPEFLEDFCQFLTTIRTAKSCRGDISSLRIFFGPICPSLKFGTHVNARFREGDEGKPIKDRLQRKHVAVKEREEVSLIFKRVCEKARRFYEIATFYQYAVADGIHRLLFASPGGPLPPPPPTEPGQLLLAFAKRPT